MNKKIEKLIVNKHRVEFCHVAFKKKSFHKNPYGSIFSNMALYCRYGPIWPMWLHIAIQSHTEPYNHTG